MVLVKQKPSRSPNTHALLIPYIQPLEAPILSNERSGSGFPCTPHLLNAITRTSHSYSVELDNKEIVEEWKATLSKRLTRALHILQPEAIRVPMEKTACDCITWDHKLHDIHAPRVAQTYLNPRTPCFQVLNSANQMTLTYFVGSN